MKLVEFNSMALQYKLKVRELNNIPAVGTRIVVDEDRAAELLGKNRIGRAFVKVVGDVVFIPAGMPVPGKLSEPAAEPQNHAEPEVIVEPAADDIPESAIPEFTAEPISESQEPAADEHKHFIVFAEPMTDPDAADAAVDAAIQELKQEAKPKRGRKKVK